MQGFDKSFFSWLFVHMFFIHCKFVDVDVRNRTFLYVLYVFSAMFLVENWVRRNKIMYNVQEFSTFTNIAIIISAIK